MSPAWDSDREVTGPSALKLWLSSTTDDADVFVVLRLFDPAGEEVLFIGAVDPRTPVAKGWLRASHRKLDQRSSRPWRPIHTHDEVAPLVSGRTYALDVEIWPTSVVIPAGFRLGVTVQGHDFDHGGTGIPLGEGMVAKGSEAFTHVNRPADPYGGDVAVHTGGDTPSHLLLPVIGADGG